MNISDELYEELENIFYKRFAKYLGISSEEVRLLKYEAYDQFDEECFPTGILYCFDYDSPAYVLNKINGINEFNEVFIPVGAMAD